MARILVVEDDSDVRDVVIDFLQAAGYAVLSAESADRARMLLGDAKVDLALIDCLMKGEQGDSLAEHAAKLGIPTILTSGHPHYLETAGKHSLTFLAKPFRLTELEELISEKLASAGDNTASPA